MPKRPAEDKHPATATLRNPEAIAAQIAAESAERSEQSLMAGQVDRRSISEQVATRIMAMIKSGNIRSGDRLPTEAQMGLAFGISRPPLREALKALTLMGLLESRQGGRHTVTDLSPGRLASPFTGMMPVTDYDVSAHFQAREVVDLALVRLCCRNASAAQRQRILKLATDGRAFYADPVAFRLMDIEFHQSINAASGNRFLALVSQCLYDVHLEVRRAASAAPGNIPRSVEQHIDVANALMIKDEPAAVALFRSHLEHVRDSTIAVLHQSRP